MTQQKSFQYPASGGASSSAHVESYDFQPSPIRGYPGLHWQGKRPFTSTHYYPTQRQEIHGPAVAGWRNKLYWGDNFQVMSHLLKEFRGQVQLETILEPAFVDIPKRKKTGQGRYPTSADAGTIRVKITDLLSESLEVEYG